MGPPGARLARDERDNKKCARLALLLGVIAQIAITKFPWRQENPSAPEISVSIGHKCRSEHSQETLARCARYVPSPPSKTRSATPAKVRVRPSSLSWTKVGRDFSH